MNSPQAKALDFALLPEEQERPIRKIIKSDKDQPDRFRNSNTDTPIMINVGSAYASRKSSL